MKLASQSPCDFSSPAQIFEVTEYNSPSETEPIKEDIWQREGENGMMSNVGNNSDIVPARPKHEDLGTTTGHESGMNMECLISSNSMNVSHDKVPPSSSHTSEVGLSEKEVDVYTDKTVTEIELPELLVCFKDSYHFIKDICVDEGVPSLDKVSISNNAMDYGSFASLLRSDMDKHCDVPKAFDNSDNSSKVLVSDNPFLSEGNEVANQMSPDQSEVKAGEDGEPDHGIIDCLQLGKVMSDTEAEVQESDKSILNVDLSNSGESRDLQNLHQDDSEPANPSLTVGHSDMKESNDINGAKEHKFDCNLDEEGSPDKDESTAPGTSGREERPVDTDNHHSSGPSLAAQGYEDNGVLDSLAGSSRSFFIQHGLGESSFSGARSLSGPIAHSGPVPHSGNISVRSDSSTGSTRSFAFPVLPSEWNSSPVKMAKADRTHLRKHRGWKVAVFCCRF